MTFVATPKDPAAKEVYTIDWTAILAPGDTISVSTWTPQAPLMQSGAAISGLKTSVYISGGVAGTTYTLVNQITTANGVIDQRTISIPVQTL
jgi:hypothetical protein